MGKRKSLADPTARKRQKVERTEEPAVSTDLWGADAPRFDRPKNKQLCERKVASVAKTVQAGKLRSVPVTAQSYNPDAAEHQRAVDEAAALLLRKEAAQKKIDALVRVNPEIRKKYVGDDLTAPNWEEELVGEPRPEDAKSKRKTRQQRNKTRRLQLEAKLRRVEKARRKVVHDVDRIEEIQEEMAAEAKESAEKQQKKKLLRLKKLLNPRIGRRRFRPAAMDLQTEDEIKPSLRSQGKVTAAMRDPLKVRYESFQARNIIPATAPLVRRPPRRAPKYYLVSKAQ